MKSFLTFKVINTWIFLSFQKVLTMKLWQNTQFPTAILFYLIFTAQRGEYLTILGNLRTTTTTWSTTTGSELECTAQARPVNVFVVVSSTTPNKVESRRRAIHKLRVVQIHCFKQFLKSFAFSYPRKSRYRSFFLLTSDVD